MTTPEPGWYPDPTQPDRLRWWTGTHWTDDFAPQPPTSGPTGVPYAPGAEPGGGLRGVGDMLGDAFEASARRAGHVLPLLLLSNLLPSFLLGFLLFPVIDGLRYSNETLVSQADGEVWRITLGAVLVVSASAWGAIAVAHQLWFSVDGSGPPWSESATVGVKSMPRFVGWGILGALPIIAGLFVVAMLFVVSTALGVIALLAGMVALVWYGVSISFFTTAVVALPHANPITASIRATRGIFWPVFGRLIMLGIVGFACAFALGIVITPLSAVLGATLDLEAAVETNSDGTLQELRGNLLAQSGAMLGVTLLLGRIANAVAGVLTAAGICSAFRSVVERAQA